MTADAPKFALSAAPVTIRKLLVLPEIASIAEFQDLICRLAWYLGRSSFRQCVVFVADAGLIEWEWEVPGHMDAGIADSFSMLRPRLRCQLGLDERAFQKETSQAELVLVWKKDAGFPFLPPAKFSEWLKDRPHCVLDPERERGEGNAWLEVNRQLRIEREREAERQREKFAALCARLGHFRRAYTIASGPSCKDYARFDYRDSLVVICNSVIRDASLMERLKPQILVFADPIFQFGPSKYAADFRECLRATAARHDFEILIPLSSYGFFTDLMPDLRGRTIGLPLFEDGDPNLDLIQKFGVRGTDNILTYMMLPVAMTFARDVGIIGCDGRARADNQYFWQHNTRVQFTDRMENIQKVHPAFFAIDYNDYYDAHCENLARLLRQAEADGITVKSLTFSHIPALAERQSWGESVIVIGETETYAVESETEAWFLSADPGGVRLRRGDTPAVVRNRQDVIDDCVAWNPSAILFLGAAETDLRLANQLIRRCPGALVCALDPEKGLERLDTVIDLAGEEAAPVFSFWKKLGEIRSRSGDRPCDRSSRSPLLGPYSRAEVYRVDEKGAVEDFARALGLELWTSRPAQVPTLDRESGSFPLGWMHFSSLALGVRWIEQGIPVAARPTLVVSPFGNEDPKDALRGFCGTLREAGYGLYFSEWHPRRDGDDAWFRLSPQSVWPVATSSFGHVIALDLGQVFRDVPGVRNRRGRVGLLLSEIFRNRGGKGAAGIFHGNVSTVGPLQRIRRFALATWESKCFRRQRFRKATS